jgi:hypothetical protein
MDEQTMPSLVDRLERQRAWSQETFGPRQTTTGVLNHVRKELAEIEEDPSDPVEWMDGVILLFDGAMRAGHNAETLVAAWMAKLDANEQRRWPDWRTQDPDAPIEHIRSSSHG